MRLKKKLLVGEMRGDSLGPMPFRPGEWEIQTSVMVTFSTYNVFVVFLALPRQEESRAEEPSLTASSPACTTCSQKPGMTCSSENKGVSLSPQLLNLKSHP